MGSSTCPQRVNEALKITCPQQEPLIGALSHLFSFSPVHIGTSETSPRALAEPKNSPSLPEERAPGLGGTARWTLSPGYRQGTLLCQHNQRPRSRLMPDQRRRLHLAARRSQPLPPDFCTCAHRRAQPPVCMAPRCGCPIPAAPRCTPEEARPQPPPPSQYPASAAVSRHTGMRQTPPNPHSPPKLRKLFWVSSGTPALPTRAQRALYPCPRTSPYPTPHAGSRPRHQGP